MHVVWERDLHQAPNSRAVLSDEVVLVLERHSKLARLDPTTGELIWACDVANTWGWPCVAGDAVLYLNQHRRLQCFGLASGEGRWEQLLAPRIWGSVVALDDRAALVGGWRGYSGLRCLSLLDGSLLWERDLRGAAISSPVVLEDLVLLAYPEAGRLEFVDTATGESDRVVLLGTAGRRDTPVLAVDRAALYCCEDHRVLRLALDGADRAWVTIGELGDAAISTPPTVTGEVVVVGDDTGRTTAFATTGGRLWSIDVPQQGPRALATTCDGRTLVATNHGQIVVVGDGGQIEEQRTVAQRITSMLAPGPRDTLLLTTKGTVMALGVGAAP